MVHTVPRMSYLRIIRRYDKAVIDEQGKSPEERVVAGAGKMDAKKHLALHVQALMSSNIGQAMGTMLDTVVF